MTDKRLSGRRILVVEDEYMLVMMLEQMLEDAGAEVTVAGKVQEAVALAGAGSFDAALLDVNLDGSRSYPIADTLNGRGIPFVFATGYGKAGISEDYARHPVLMKPFREDELLAQMARLVAPAPE